MRLFHLSDRGDITRFEPRLPPSAQSQIDTPMVWAIAESHLHNYLLPRDCPRVTFFATAESKPEDVERLLGVTSARFVVAIESRWFEAVRTARLWCYELPPEPFDCYDSGAGYYTARTAIEPLAITQIDDLLGALLERDVELRITPSLWQLRDAVLTSTLQYSFIRMRNAQPVESA